MFDKKLIQPLLGTRQVKIKNLTSSSNDSILTLEVELPKSEQNRCPFCHKKCPRYDAGQGMRNWRALDCGTAQLFVRAPSPRVSCLTHGVITAAVPFARPHSRFTIAFEDQVAWLSTHSSKSVVAQLMRIEWHTVGGICARVFEHRKQDFPNPFDGLIKIGIDETSYKKGHKYMTLVVNHDTNKVVWCAIGYGKTILTQFFKLLSPEQRASIACLSADGAKWMASCLEEFCPQAERCVDPFHVVSWATDLLDELRRQAFKQAKSTLRKRLNGAGGVPRKGRKAPQNRNPKP